MRPADERYFEGIEAELDRAFAVANAARERGGDPESEVEIPVAKDMADRVENILGIDGVAERVRELEGQMSREEAALALVEDFVAGTVGDYDTRAGKIEGAVRTAVALLTEGVVAAPIEGIDRVEVLANDDGTEFVNVYYAGPIRSAGGTAQALSVLVADYARALLGLAEYKPRDDEVGRYAEEVALYDEETGLQYSPSETEAEFIARHMPIMLDGEATGDEEVSGYRDLERVDTNASRGGMCLVLAEGIALKAPKIQRYTRELEEVAWPWLQDLIDGTFADGDTAEDADPDSETTADGESGETMGDGSRDGDVGEDAEAEDGPPRPDPSKKYLEDLIAGRPVFAHPSAPGGFRLRYGRARNHGHAAAGVHPATMHLVDDFLATGTQIKTERPGKAAGVVPVDTIEGPTVRLATGEVRRVDDTEEALEVRNGVEKILDLGEYLVNYGEFVENNHPLAPASYTVEWWVQEFEAAGGPVRALRDGVEVDLADPSPAKALEWATEYDAPLHPAYTYLWHDASVDDVAALAGAIDDATVATGDGAVPADRGADDRGADGDRTLRIPRSGGVRETLEALLVEHTQSEDRLVVPEWRPLVRTLGFAVTDQDGSTAEERAPLSREWTLADLSGRARSYADGENAIEAVNEVAPFTVRERAPTRVGNRMGRPEKSEERELSPAVHTLFPIGEAGGNQRDVAAAAESGDAVEGTRGEVDVEVGRRECLDCGTRTYRARCPECNGETAAVYVCPDCDREVEPDAAGRAECPRCEIPAEGTRTATVDVGGEFRAALDRVGERPSAFDTLKGVKGLSSAAKLPEPLEKGVLRAKHDVSAFKDGTVRYDMTDLPVTAVRPAELDVTAADMRELGYESDVRGDPLEHDDQLVELKVQDVVLSDGGADHLLRTADFVDDLLEQYYGLDPYYEMADRQDLVGELVFGMAPHTSAAVVGRVVGYTSAAVGYAHPYFHASKRRNCFHPETKVWFEDESGSLRYERIDSLVETYLERSPTIETDDFGTVIGQLDGLDDEIRVPALSTTGQQVNSPVQAVSKHPAPEHMVRIETRSGRSITVTPDHDVHVYDPSTDRLVGKEASDVTSSDSLATPRSIDRTGTDGDTRRFDLLELFVESEAVPNDRLMIKGLDKERLYDLFTDSFGDDWDGQFYPLASMTDRVVRNSLPPGHQNRLALAPAGSDIWYAAENGYARPYEVFETNKKTLSNYLYRESFPVSYLQQCFSTTDDLLAFAPEDVTLGMKRDRTEIDRFIDLNERVATLLGYYAAEGFAREQETPKGTIHQTTICGTEEEAREFFVAVLSDEFGVDPSVENHAKITVSGRLLRVFFDTILDAGVRADTKRVPAPIFDAPKDIVAAYLGGYFSGDGGVDANTLSVEATTVSHELKEDLLGLLTRLGIKASVTTPGRVPLHKKFPEFYDADEETLTAQSYVVTIASDDAVRFSEVVDLHLARKRRRLQNHVETVASRGRRMFNDGSGQYVLEDVEEVEFVRTETEYVYCLTVEETHSVIANDISQKQCDGDEDCVMLLMDGLLNFSRTYLPDQRGGSVAEDSRLVAVDPEGDIRFLTFEEFWTELDAPIEVDGRFRKRTCASSGWQTYTFDDEHGAALQPIERAIRYRATDSEGLVRVETQFGRELEITGNHSLFGYDDGIEEVAGSDLSEGDLVVAPRELDIETRPTTIDVTACVDDPYVVIDDHVEDLLRTAWETTDHGSETHQQFRSGLAYRLNKGKIPYDRFEAILDSAGFAVPRDVDIGLPGSSDGIASKIDVDEDFAWLLGLYVAEGSTSSVCPTIHNADEELIDRAANIIADALGHEPGRRWSNRTYELRFPAVFAEVLYELGFERAESYDSSEKVIPACIRHAPEHLVRAFLRGFVAGDGSDQSDDNVTTVSFYSTSEDVKDGLVFLLHRLGLVANVSKRTDRDGNRQDIYTVTVSGGANDNPLHRVLEGDEPYLPKSLVISIPEALMDIREMDIEGVKQTIPKYLKRRENVSLEKLGEMVEALDSQDLPDDAKQKLDAIRPLADGDLSYLRVKNVERVEYDGYLYDLQVGGDPVFTANWLYAHNSMDAPLVMSSRIDPTEIDDEAHNIDIMREYPREFYEAAREMADPADVADAMTIAEETLGTDHQYRGFAHTHDTSDIAAGPDLSAYKTLESMDTKMDAQLHLSRKLRAVEESDVAERIIEYHFLPDLLGNLKAFTGQEMRCLACGEKYRRAPLTGNCRECGGDVNLTVHEGSVTKYMDTALRVAEEFGARSYTKQRLRIIEKRIERVFEDDQNKQSGIADFM